MDCPGPVTGVSVTHENNSLPVGKAYGTSAQTYLRKGGSCQGQET